jgi:eukaryotic-like serine/threonine-protein kinase
MALSGNHTTQLAPRTRVAQPANVTWSYAAAGVLAIALVALETMRASAAPPAAVFATPLLWLLLLAVVAYPASRPRPAAVDPEHASSLGSYHLIAPIGSGGMGEVWKASHHLLARQAAIKLVRPASAGSFAKHAEMFVERFKREANAIARLQSPHTIYLYDFGASHDGQFYYVMELLDGISLQTLVQSFGPQPAERVRSILLQICESLEEAHQQGLIHRDMKPSNVMLCKVALRYDFVKVLDFGLAKCAACEDPDLTQAGATTGTPGYIAPEVALGEAGVDGRADLYALGCVAYFLLTGTLVFPDSNPMSMALKHVQAPPDPPSARTELPVPADLEAIVMQCLEKDPAARPASAREIMRALRRCEIPEWNDVHASEWWEKHLPTGSSLRGTGTDAEVRN